MSYECKNCGANDCKLWRQSNCFAEQVELICWECLEAKGYVIPLHAEARRSDQIYNPEIESTNYLPAVPDLDGHFWGYSSVPSWWVAWWKSLPDKGSDCTLCCGSGKLEEFECMFCKGTGARVSRDTSGPTSR